jgi:hypothetical protein
MQNREKDHPLHMENQTSVCKLPPEDLAKPELLPEPAENERRADPNRRCGRPFLSPKNRRVFLENRFQGLG